MRTVLDDLGVEVAVPAVAERVVSLVPALTETLEVAVPGRLVGVTDYCTHPPGLRVPTIGGSKYPKLDAVFEQAPDLVLANSEESRPEDVQRLRGAGVPVWVMAAPATVPQALESLRRLLTEVFALHEPEWLRTAARLWADPLPERARAVVPVWRKPWVVVGRDTFAGDVLHRLGVSNVYSNAAERYPRPKIDELRAHVTAGTADLLVLPDEPYEFTADDGPGFFPDVGYVLVSGRYLTWYGPSLVDAHRELSAAITAAVGDSSRS